MGIFQTFAAATRALAPMCAMRTPIMSQRMSNGRNFRWHPPAARLCDSGVRTRGCTRTDGLLKTICSCDGSCRSRVRDAHTDDVRKGVEMSAFAHRTPQPGARVAAASAREAAPGLNGTR